MNAFEEISGALLHTQTVAAQCDRVYPVSE